jgi:hypothetical protein
MGISTLIACWLAAARRGHNNFNFSVTVQIVSGKGPVLIAAVSNTGGRRPPVLDPKASIPPLVGCDSSFTGGNNYLHNTITFQVRYY